MPLTIETDSDDEWDDVTRMLYDSTCNQRYSRKGFNRMCTDGMTPKTLASQGWRYVPTRGRNSYIFMKGSRVLKISKHAEVRNRYCLHVNARMDQIRALWDALGQMAPRLHHLKVCSFHGEPTLAILMDRVGQRLDDVPIRLVASAATHMARHGVFSRDIVTDVVKVNTGNLAFELTTHNRRLRVFFLDVDDTSNYVNTSAVPFRYMHTLWYKVICTCLDIPVDAITYEEYERVATRWRPFFPL